MHGVMSPSILKKHAFCRVVAMVLRHKYKYIDTLIIVILIEISSNPNFRRQLTDKWWRLFIRHQSSVVTSRPCTIAVCTSAQRSNVAGLLAELGALAPKDVDFRLVELPYNDLDSFRLQRGLYDGLILCHSIHNRRFAITDVLDALYNQFLSHVANLLGKANVAVIVHDFSWPLRQTTKYSDELFSESEVHAMVKEAFMDSFRVRQPTTFECCHIARICGRLEEGMPRPEMDEGDMDEIKTFISNIHANFNQTKKQRSSVHDDRQHQGTSVEEEHDHHELNISSAIRLQQDKHHQHEKHQHTSSKEGHELCSANTSDCDKAEEKTWTNILYQISCSFSFI